MGRQRSLSAGPPRRGGRAAEAPAARAGPGRRGRALEDPPREVARARVQPLRRVAAAVAVLTVAGEAEALVDGLAPRGPRRIRRARRIGRLLRLIGGSSGLLRESERG